jgi:hypothetical protein
MEEDDNIQITVRLPHLPGEQDVSTTVAIGRSSEVTAFGSPIIAAELRRSLINNTSFNSPLAIVQESVVIPVSTERLELIVQVVNDALNVGDKLMDKNNVLVGHVHSVEPESERSSLVRVFLECPTDRMGDCLVKQQKLKIER